MEITPLRQAAIDFIKEWDEKNGTAWSESTDDISVVMEAFVKNGAKQIVTTIKKGTGNRCHWKRWELEVLALLGEYVKQ